MKRKAEELIKALEHDNPGAEAITLYQNGEIVLEHRFVPQHERPIYSHTKSFLSTLVGIAVDEGKICLDDKIIDMFPEYENIITDERVRDIKLRHFLTMSSGFGDAFLMSATRRKGEGLPDYMAYILSKPLVYLPGEKFVYSNADSHMASCMLQRAIGEPLQGYAARKLFSKLEIGYPAWESDPKGVPFGGTGLYLTVNNMMKLGILYLNNGKWNGEQIVSEAWVKEASRKQIETGIDSPWNSGYGYQFWIIENRQGVYRADGAYGQYSIVLPDENAVIGTQCSEYNDTEKFANILRKYVID